MPLSSAFGERVNVAFNTPPHVDMNCPKVKNNEHGSLTHVVTSITKLNSTHNHHQIRQFALGLTLSASQEPHTALLLPSAGLR